MAVGKPIDANGVSCASSFPACLCPVDDGDSSSVGCVDMPKTAAAVACAK